MSKVMGADTVVALNKKAVLKKYNRTLSAGVVDRLDDNGINIVVFHLLHGDDYIRARVMLKLDDRDAPVEGWLDVGLEDFGKLAEIERKDGEYVVTKVAE